MPLIRPPALFYRDAAPSNKALFLKPPSPKAGASGACCNKCSGRTGWLVVRRLQGLSPQYVKGVIRDGQAETIFEDDRFRQTYVMLYTPFRQRQSNFSF